MPSSPNDGSGSRVADGSTRELSWSLPLTDDTLDSDIQRHILHDRKAKKLTDGLGEMSDADE
jgi:hypothetical protein